MKAGFLRALFLVALLHCTVVSKPSKSLMVLDGLSLGMTRQECDTIQAVFRRFPHSSCEMGFESYDTVEYFQGEGLIESSSIGPVVGFDEAGNVVSIVGTELEIANQRIPYRSSPSKVLETLGLPGSTRIEFSELYASLFDKEDSFDKQLVLLGLQGESPERIVTRKWMIYPSLGLTVSVSCGTRSEVDAFEIKSKQQEGFSLGVI